MMNQHESFVKWSILFFTSLFVFGWQLPAVLGAYSSTIGVTTTEDELNNDGDCSLREAIQAANDDSEVDGCVVGNGVDVVLLPAGIYTLTISGANEDSNLSGDLDIRDDLIINGAGSATTVVSGNQLDRVWHILNSSTVELNQIAVTNGHAADGDNSNGQNGGGVLINSGSVVTLNDSMVEGNRAGNGDEGSYGGFAGGSGGGIYSSGTLTLNNSTVHYNLAGNGGNAPERGGYGGAGGGIAHANGTLMVINSTVSHNKSGNGGDGTDSGGGYDGDGGNGGDGGGIYNAYNLEGVLTLFGSAVSYNETGDGGNGVPPWGYSGTSGNGGGIANGQTATITNSHISQNLSSTGSGGGIYNLINLTLIGSTVNGNFGGNSGGGVSFPSNIGSLIIKNSTISQNSTDSHGGGIDVSHGYTGTSTTLNNVTITQNVSDSDNDGFGDGGGISYEDFWGSNPFKISNTLVVANFDLSGTGAEDCGAYNGTLISEGYNLVGQDTGCPHNGAGDQETEDPGLEPLADNGGTTLTHALQPNSPAIDAGNPAPPGNGSYACEMADQRGVARPEGSVCDIGAFEWNGLPTPTPMPTFTASPTSTPTYTPTPTATPTPTPTQEAVAFEMEGEFWFNNGDHSLSSFVFFATGRFTDSEGYEGLWRYQPAEQKLYLRFNDDSEPCYPLAVGQFTTLTTVRGWVVCRHTPSVWGVWQGFIHDLTEKGGLP